MWRRVSQLAALAVFAAKQGIDSAALLALPPGGWLGFLWLHGQTMRAVDLGMSGRVAAQDER